MSCKIDLVVSPVQKWSKSKTYLGFFFSLVFSSFLFFSVVSLFFDFVFSDKLMPLLSRGSLSSEWKLSTSQGRLLSPAVAEHLCPWPALRPRSHSTAALCGCRQSYLRQDRVREVETSSGPVHVPLCALSSGVNTELCF